MREKMRQVMRFSGLHFVRRGRLDWLFKYFLLSRQLARNEVSLRPELPPPGAAIPKLAKANDNK
jgi:hypothetical protein